MEPRAPTRLRNGDEIRAVRAQGVCLRGARVTLYVADASDYRFGVIAGRRVGIAVKRNRARRIVREALRHLWPRLRADRGAALLAVAQPEIAGASMGDVARELEALLLRQGLLAQ